MLIPMTEEEIQLLIKQHQLVFMLKRQNKFKSTQYLNKIKDLVFDMTDDEIEEKYKLYEDRIKKEIWVDCYPMYFHISEFENALNEQLAFIYLSESNWYQHMRNVVNDFYRQVNKSHINELTLEEKQKLFWMTHPITY